MTSDSEGFDPASVERWRGDRILQAELPNASLNLHTTWGLFSPKEIDPGTELLLSHLAVRTDDVALDIGCGYGPLGLAIAQQAPHGEVHLVDRDFVAIDYAQSNARRNGLQNVQVYLSNGLSAVPESLPLTLVVSNLPAKVGNELFYLMFVDAWRRMQPDARIVVVTINGLRSFIKRAFTDVFGNYRKLKQGKAYTVAEAVRQR